MYIYGMYINVIIYCKLLLIIYCYLTFIFLNNNYIHIYYKYFLNNFCEKK